MENVTDALHIAFGVLAFVIALSVSMMAFGQVRLASESILNYNDKEQQYTYIDYNMNVTNRTVTAVDIVPTLYRAYKENYLIKFEGLETKTGQENLYTVKKIIKDPTTSVTTTVPTPTATIDLEGQAIRNHEDAVKFITALLEGATKFNNLVSNGNYAFIEGGYLQNKPFYDILKENTFEEKLGVFYQEDRKENPASDAMDDINKTKKRIITYIVQ